jgi:alpha-tubulin suppressor-like RCC1 family protein
MHPLILALLVAAPRVVFAQERFAFVAPVGVDSIADEIAMATLPIPLVISRAVLTVTRGTEHACALTADAHAVCWGSNRLGQLGDDGTKNHQSGGVTVATAQTFVSISAGANHTCALTRDGVAYCWGLNFTGELAQAFVADVCDGFPCNRRPLRVETSVKFDTLSAGFGHTCALSEGRAFCWGRNDRGQLGSSRADDLCEGVPCNVTPIRVEGIERFTSISAGGDHTCGIVAAEAYCWGSNQYGQLGVDASIARSAKPLRVNIGEPVASIEARGIRTCVTTERGVRRCWGAP